MKYEQHLLPNTRLELADSDDRTHIIDSTHEAWCGTLDQIDTRTFPTDSDEITCLACQKALEDHNAEEAKYDEGNIQWVAEPSMGGDDETCAVQDGGGLIAERGAAKMRAKVKVDKKITVKRSRKFKVGDRVSWCEVKQIDGGFNLSSHEGMIDEVLEDTALIIGDEDCCSECFGEYTEQKLTDLRHETEVDALTEAVLNWANS